MIRRLVAGLIVVGLAVGIWVLWPRGDSSTTATTAPDAVASTASSTAAMSTTTIEATTSSGENSHVVTTVEEAEEILRELWFGWFEGIYNQDEERIKEVVGTQAMLDSAREAFGSASFVAAPSLDQVLLSDTEILRADEACTSVWIRIDVRGFRGPEAVASNVVILRQTSDGWKLATTWTHKADLWEADCEAELDSLS